MPRLGVTKLHRLSILGDGLSPPSPNSSPQVGRRLLSVLVDNGEPMTAGQLDATLDDARHDISVARVAGFVRAVPGTSAGDPQYLPTSLGYALAGRRGR